MNDNFFLSLEESIDWDRRPLVSYKRRPIYLPDFFYNETINIYNQLFTSPKVLILTYEELKMSPQNFLKKIGSFIVVDDFLPPVVLFAHREAFVAAYQYWIVAFAAFENF